MVLNYTLLVYVEYVKEKTMLNIHAFYIPVYDDMYIVVENREPTYISREELVYYCLYFTHTVQ